MDFPRPSWATIDLDELLVPISEDQPSGESLRYEGTYDKIAEGRKADQAHLPRGVWERSLKVSDWKKVDKLCVEALLNKTKDLQIGLWLCEAWTHRHAISGFRYGLQLVLGLCERFWDDLHPQIRDGDIDYRVAPLVWLNENLTDVLKTVPMTVPSDSDLPVCSLLEWDSVLRLEKLQEMKPEAYESEEKEGKVTRSRFMDSARHTDAAYLLNFVEETERAQAILRTLDDLLDDRCGNDGPSLGRMREALASMHHVLTDLVLPVIGVVRPSASASDADEDTSQGMEDDMYPDEAAVAEPAAGGDLVARGQIRGRAHAYALISDVADYLARIEPHSPTPYLLRRAVSWGDKSLVELMDEFVADPSELRLMYLILGLEPKM